MHIRHPKTAFVQAVVLKHPTKQHRWAKKKIKKKSTNSIVTDGRKQSEGLVIAAMASVVRVIVCWLVAVPATCISGTDLHRHFTCCHTEIEVADQTFYLTQSQYTDTGPTTPSTDPITPGAWQGSHWSAKF